MTALADVLPPPDERTCRQLLALLNENSLRTAEGVDDAA